MGILSDKYRNDCIEFSNVVNLQAYRVTFPAISEAASFIVVADGYIEAELAACAFIKKEAKYLLQILSGLISKESKI